MKELPIQQQIKKAYTDIHAPEALIRSVISQIGVARECGRIAQKSITTFPEKKKEKRELTIKLGKS